MSAFALSQILVGLAICSDILSFQFKERRHIVLTLMLSCSLISSHFMLLEHWTAATIGIVAAIRFGVSIFSTSRIFMFIFVGATLLTSVLTYQGYLSILSCAGGTMGTIASFCKEDRTLRKIMFLGTCLWLTHNFLAGSPGAVIMEVIFISSNLIGYYRYYIRPQKQVMHP